LSRDSIFRIQFAEIGVQVNSDKARALFRSAGAMIDDAARIVKIPSKLVEDLIGRAPATIRLCGRDASGALDCEVGGRKVHMGTGGTALNVQEPGRDDTRPAELDDVCNMARLVDALENIHFYMLNVYPHDLSGAEVDVNRFGAALNRTEKHIMGGVYSVDGIRNVVKMAEIIAGSPQALRARPFISMVTCGISPFKMDDNYGELTMEAAAQGIPLAVPSEPLCGATAPVTLAGNLVVMNVDTLIGVMLTQLVNPGTPVLYGCVASTADLRDFKYLSGAVEMGLINAAASQLAQFYHLPIYATAGMSDAKVNDAQAGYESGLTNLLVALAGGNWIHDAAGFLEFCLCASYEKLVIDNEILGMVLRAVRGITVDEKTLAFDLLKEVGPGGHFVSQRHTRRHMRREQYLPSISDRSNRKEWNEQGGKSIRQHARQKVAEILAHPLEPKLSSEIRAQIQANIPGLKPEVLYPRRQGAI